MEIRFVNMPPSSLKWPSIGLSQLKSILEKTDFQEEIEVKIDHLNYEFARFIGIENYCCLTSTRLFKAYNYLEWFFRSVAFPRLPDNRIAYFQNEGIEIQRAFSPKEIPEAREKIMIANQLLPLRGNLEDFLDEIIIQLGLDKADVVGFTSMFSQNVPSMALARLIKKHNPNVITVMGGSNCESPMGEEIVRNFEMIDYVFSGPSLCSFPTFIKHLINNNQSELKKINGVFSRSNLEQVNYSVFKSNFQSGTILPIGDELGRDEYLELDYDSFLHTRRLLSNEDLPEAGLFFETSKGCWWGERAHCTFCGLNSTTMDYKSSSASNAIQQISQLTEKYGEEVRQFLAVDNIMDKNYPEEVFAKLRPKHQVKIHYEVKSDLSLEQLSLMKSGGVKAMQPGIEALNSNLLKLMKKGVTSTQNIRFIKDVTKLHMDLNWALLIGFPGESEQHYFHYQESIQHLTHLHPPDVIGGVAFCRYSPYHFKPEEFNLKLKPISGYYDVYPPLSEEVFSNLAYFFEDISVNPEYRNNLNKWYLPLNTLVQNWQDRWSQKDGKLAPELYFESDSIVYDSRSGTSAIHSLSDQQAKMVRFFAMPTNIGKFKNEFQKRNGSAQEDLELLVKKGLVFQDQMKGFISLVFDQPVKRDSVEERFTLY